MRNSSFVIQKSGAFILFLLFICGKIYSQEKKLDATSIAFNHYNSIVKILLIDSVAEKKAAGSGYLGRGSGFFVSEDGIIFTNRHVVKYGLGLINYKDYDKESNSFYTETGIYNPGELQNNHYEINHISRATIVVQVFTNRNGSTSNLYLAKIIAIDSTNYDGAILKIVSEINGNKVNTKFNPVKIADSDSTYQGEDLCLYGFPAQYDGAVDVMLRDQSTLTFGKHSGFDYVVNSDYGFIKTDAAINSGNSGGPVFNKENKVIGISTAASNKTNMGFIAGINGMYNIVKKDNEIAGQLSHLNLQPPSNKNVKQSGIVANPVVSIPGEDVRKKYNLDQRNVRNFKGGYWYIKGFTTITNNDYLGMNPYIGPASETVEVNQSPKININCKSSYQLELGKVFSLWRINQSNKLSVDWTILNATQTTYDYSASELFKDLKGNYQFDHKTESSILRATSKLGLMYSTMIKKRICVDVYYKPGFNVIFGEDEVVGQKITYTQYNDSVVTFDESIWVEQSMGLMHCMGFNLRYRALTLGLEYNTGNQWMAFYPLLYTAEPQSGAGLWHYYDVVYGTQFFKNLNFSLGLTLGNKNRWKHLKD